MLSSKHLQGITSCFHLHLRNTRSAVWTQFTERAIKTVMLAQLDARAFQAHRVRASLVSSLHVNVAWTTMATS